VNDDTSRKARAFGSAGVSPPGLHGPEDAQNRRRDAGATKRGGNSREMVSFTTAKVLARNAGQMVQIKFCTRLPAKSV